MSNEPLSSTDLSKLLIFGLLILVAIASIGLGVLPLIFLAFGIFMLKRNEDFSHIETAARITEWYFFLVAIGSAMLGVVELLEEHYYRNDTFLIFGTSAAALAYIAATHFLFLQPLEIHQKWIEKNGIFSSRQKSTISPREDNDIDIIKGERLKSYSVADELIKWAQLKEAGHISENEFQDARKKLLQKN